MFLLMKNSEFTFLIYHRFHILHFDLHIVPHLSNDYSDSAGSDIDL